MTRLKIESLIFVKVMLKKEGVIGSDFKDRYSLVNLCLEMSLIPKAFRDND